MTKPKTLEQLRAEKERAETQLAQEQHKLERLENRKKYLEKGERTKRTHRLCNLGGTIESLAPEVKDLTRTEMTELIRFFRFLHSILLSISCSGQGSSRFLFGSMQTRYLLCSCHFAVAYGMGNERNSICPAHCRYNFRSNHAIYGNASS